MWLLRCDRHFDEPYVLEEMHATAVRVKAVGEAVAIGVGERGN